LFPPPHAFSSGQRWQLPPDSVQVVPEQPHVCGPTKYQPFLHSTWQLSPLRMPMQLDGGSRISSMKVFTVHMACSKLQSDTES
jgi:hypothetical protein